MADSPFMTALNTPITFAASTLSPAQSPLNPSHLAELQLADKRSRKIRRAATVATIDASLSAFFTALTALSAILSPSAILLAIPLGIVTFNSFRGAKRLRALDLTAPKFLALNQLALAAILITYASISIYLASRGSSGFSSAVNSEPTLAPMLANIQQLYWIISLAIYGSLIVGTILAQGLAALYYLSRKKHLQEYINATPPWILQLQKTKVGG
jgi:hypothetical protein